MKSRTRYLSGRVTPGATRRISRRRRQFYAACACLAALREARESVNGVGDVPSAASGEPERRPSSVRHSVIRH
jgi:hypothetical protein